MSNLNIIRRFAADKSGAVTVDWVALTAAVVIIGIGIVYAVFGNDTSGIGSVVNNLDGELTQAATNIENAVATTLPTSGS